jgi:hypothetical protein
VTSVRPNFRLRDASALVEVTVEPNTNPESLDGPPHARNFPVCTATVAYAGEGYKAALGWVQLVRSPTAQALGRGSRWIHSNRSVRLLIRFVSLALRRSCSTHLRAARVKIWIWRAGTFLCFVPLDADGRETRAILGFSWGFTIHQKAISLLRPVRLASVEWNNHRDFLSRQHPGWAFTSGYQEH